MTKEKVLWVVAVVALVLGGYASVRLLPIRGDGGQLGAAGNLLAENYIPYVLYNGGYNSAKDFTISGASLFSGGASSTGVWTASGGSKVGQNGTNLSNIREGLAYIYPYAALIPASTTKLADLQLNSAAGTAGVISVIPGVAANDTCFANLSTTTAGTTFGGLGIRGVSASTTAGFVTVAIYNGTGQDFTWPITTNATGTAYYRCSR